MVSLTSLFVSSAVSGSSQRKPHEALYLRLLWHGPLASTALWSRSDSSLQLKTWLDIQSSFLGLISRLQQGWVYLASWLHFTPTWKIQHSLSVSRFLPASPLRGPFAVEGAIDSWQWLWPGDLGGPLFRLPPNPRCPQVASCPSLGSFSPQKTLSLSQYCRHAPCPQWIWNIGYSMSHKLLQWHDANIFYSKPHTHIHSPWVFFWGGLFLLLFLFFAAFYVPRSWTLTTASLGHPCPGFWPVLVTGAIGRRSEGERRQ